MTGYRVAPVNGSRSQTQTLTDTLGVYSVHMYTPTQKVICAH
jgi:hypothetical protein